MGLKKLFGRIIPWVGLSALCGYLAISDVNHESTSYSKNSGYNTRSINNLIDSSYIVNVNEKSKLDGIDERLDNTMHNIMVDENAVKQADLNNEYLMGKSEKIFLYADRIYPTLTDKINSLLDTLESINRKEQGSTLECTHISEDWSLGSKLRIYLMLDALQETSFRNTIGEMIFKDVADEYAEHGGLVIFNNDNTLQFNNIPSNLKRTKDHNELYRLNEELLKIPFMAIYHLHATTFDESDFAGPGSWDTLTPFVKIIFHGEPHEFVITSLNKGKFNIDYYGGDSAHGGLKILDLGVYSYSLPDTASLSK